MGWAAIERGGETLTMGGRERCDISGRVVGGGAGRGIVGQPVMDANNISRIRIRDKTGKTWYPGDASC